MPVIHSLPATLSQYQVASEAGVTLVQFVGPHAPALAKALEAVLAQPELGVDAAFRLDSTPSQV